MNPAGPFLLPGVALVLVMLGALVVLRLDTRAQHLKRRVLTVGGGAAPLTEQDAPRSIRVAERDRTPLREALRSAVKYPVDLPGAHVLPPGLVAVIGILAGLAVSWFVLMFFAPPVALVAGIVVGLAIVRSLFNWECRRYGDRLRRQMPDMIELLASSVRAGLPVGEAFRTVAREMPSPTREEFGRVVREMALGSSAEVALMAMYRRSKVPEYAIFAVTLGVQSRSGGRLAETVQLLAETIRQRIALAARASALAAEAKLSAYVLSVLPFAGGGAMAMMQKGFLDPLLHDPRGQHLLLVGAVLLTLGQLTMRKLIASATRD
jgi:tight adherence protein B